MSTLGTPPVMSQLNLVAADVAASVAFYRLLGLEIDDTRPFSAHHIAINMRNGFLLEIDSREFAKLWDTGWHGQGGGGQNVIGFSVPSREAVDALYQKITGAGYVGQQPPYDAFWGARYAIVEDPDANPIGIMSPIDPVRRSAPPKL